MHCAHRRVIRLVHRFRVDVSPRTERPRLRKMVRVFALAATPAVLRPIHAIRNVIDTERTINGPTECSKMCSNEYVHIAMGCMMDGWGSDSFQ